MMEKYTFSRTLLSQNFVEIVKSLINEKSYFSLFFLILILFELQKSLAKASIFVSKLTNSWLIKFFKPFQKQIKELKLIKFLFSLLYDENLIKNSQLVLTNKIKIYIFLIRSNIFFENKNWIKKLCLDEKKLCFYWIKNVFYRIYFLFWRVLIFIQLKYFPNVFYFWGLFSSFSD
jgi:hypothetical protein